MLDGFRAVGLTNVGYEDNSVACHAYRAIGGRQDSFIGGGAMLVDAARTTSFFPAVYNEDWLYLLGDGVPFQAARTGEMVQRSYDPFANPQRAAEEELGDTLAEGLFWLLDSHRGLDAADESFWARSLYRRRAFLDVVLQGAEVALAGDRRREAVRASLQAARGRSAFITPRLCQDFVDAWSQDLGRWAEYLNGVRGPDLDKYLSGIGMLHRVYRSERLQKPDAAIVDVSLPEATSRPVADSAPAGDEEPTALLPVPETNDDALPAAEPARKTRRRRTPAHVMVG
jgi:hypothetical protein